MNWKLLLGFFKGGNVWETSSKALNIGGALVAANDANSTGDDDDIAGLMLSAADGLAAYGRKDYNLVGNLIDAAITGLQTLKQNLISSGRIKVK